MTKSKSQKMYEMLKEKQPQVYEQFKEIHAAFQEDPEANRAEFNRIGRDFVGIVRAYERRLCGGMERTNRSVYSTNVSETYWRFVREEFPLIDQVGVVIRA
ncbi:hypothetical protein IJJ08_01975 [bacterium]|nr:hypothetical protein [bacterium]